MKHIFSFLIIFLFLFHSCTKKDSTTQNFDTSLLNKKWTTQGSSNLKISWIEFLYGNTYLLKTQTNELKRGKYSISADNMKITLSNYAVFNITNLTTNSFNFTAIANNSTLQDIITATAGSVVSSSTRSSAITGNVWNMYKEIDYNAGVPTTTLFPQTYQNSVGTTHLDVIFSPNFTYFVTSVDRNNLGLYDTSYLTRNWLWTDATETRIKYYDAVDTGFVNILKLTTDSLNMKEKYVMDSSFYYLIRQ